MSGRVIIAGAGCGDYDLITMRGYEALKSCDVVIYDSLIDSRSLDFCKDGAEKICVGKRAGRHSLFYFCQEALAFSITSMLMYATASG